MCWARLIILVSFTWSRRSELFCPFILVGSSIHREMIGYWTAWSAAVSFIILMLSVKDLLEHLSLCVRFGGAIHRYVRIDTLGIWWNWGVFLLGWIVLVRSWNWDWVSLCFVFVLHHKLILDLGFLKRWPRWFSLLRKAFLNERLAFVFSNILRTLPKVRVSFRRDFLLERIRVIFVMKFNIDVPLIRVGLWAGTYTCSLWLWKVRLRS